MLSIVISIIVGIGLCIWMAYVDKHFDTWLALGIIMGCMFMGFVIPTFLHLVFQNLHCTLWYCSN